MPTKETIPVWKHDGHPVHSVPEYIGAMKVPADDESDDESDDELGAWIYKSSRAAAKARAEAAMIASSNAPAAQKIDQAVYEKQTSRTPCGMPVLNECSVPLNNAVLGPNKRALCVEKDDGPAPTKKGRTKCALLLNAQSSPRKDESVEGTGKTGSHEGCINQVKKGGICTRHGAKVKSCSHNGCTNQVKKRGVCIRHGARSNAKICSHEGCTTQAKKGGICTRHGAKVKSCSHDGCTNQAQKGGVCIRHGAKVVKSCSHGGYTNNSRGKRGVCTGHGAKVRTCSHEGCTNNARGKGGICVRHGAKVKYCSHEGCTKISREEESVEGMRKLAVERMH